jgi:2-succinyl-6-hydroxy-2,4-cyclohexadiene-1-carboxylate synthase
VPRGLARSLRGMGTGQQPSLWERLDRLDVSTLALAGALDGKFGEIAERMAVRSPRIRAALVPDAGHAIHVERPGVFVQHLKSFLSLP